MLHGADDVCQASLPLDMRRQRQFCDLTSSSSSSAASPSQPGPTPPFLLPLLLDSHFDATRLIPARLYAALSRRHEAIKSRNTLVPSLPVTRGLMPTSLSGRISPQNLVEAACRPLETLVCTSADFHRTEPFLPLPLNNAVSHTTQLCPSFRTPRWDAQRWQRQVRHKLQLSSELPGMVKMTGPGQDKNTVYFSSGEQNLH